MVSIKDSKLIDILKRLDEQETEHLKLFMCSPYFIDQKKVVEFSMIILDNYLVFKDCFLHADLVYERLFPGQEYRDATIKDLMTSFVHYIYKFLASEKFFNDPKEQQFCLMEALRQKELGQEFLKISSKLFSGFEREKKDKLFYYKLFRFESEMDNYNIANKEFLNSSDSLQKKADALNTFFLSSELSILCEMINRENIFAHDYDVPMIDFVLNYVDKNLERLEAYPAVGAYYRILLTLTKPANEENYFKLIELIDRKADDFPREELKDMYSYATNYCIKKLNSGNVDYEKNLFDLYRKLIDTGLIYENNNISQWDYKNIIATSLRVSEFDWTENFIKSNMVRINPVFRDVAYSFNLANLYCEKKDFPSALKTLHKFDDALKKIPDSDFDYTSYSLDSKTMFLKIYYESNEGEALNATSDSFKSYLLRNKKISERRRKIYLNLIKYTKKLNDQRQRFQSNSNKRMVRENVKKIKDEIKSENIANLSWLQARVEELEKEVG